MNSSFDMKELIPIVAGLAEKYTSKESSSIPYTTAQQLMSAVQYCIGENGMDYEEASTIATMNEDRMQQAKHAYQNGYELVLQKVSKTKTIYNEMIKDFYAYRNENYHATIVEGIPQFFLYYDAKFNPQNHILTLDYPIIKNTQGLCGIDIIYEYVTCVKLEQEFLRGLPERYVVEALTRYHNDYEELLINICSIVMQSVIKDMICGNQITSERNGESDIELLKNFISGYSKEEVEEKILALMKILIKQGYHDNELLLEYLKEDLKDFSFELMQAVEHNWC